MAGVNKVILLGYLGKDPEVRYLENGRAVANFSIATSETFKNKEGRELTSTEWHNVVLWTPLAEVAEKYLHKGSQVYIEGKLTSRSHEGRQGGTKYITEIIGSEMTLLGNSGRSLDEFVSPASTNLGAISDIVPRLAVGKPDELDEMPF